jgi:hypothetical protein
MTKQTKMYIGLVIGLATLGSVTAAVAYDRACVDPEAEMLRQLKRQGGENTPEDKEKLRSLSTYEKLELEICNRQTMSKSEQAKEIERGRQAELAHQREVAGWKEARLLGPKNVAGPKQGIYPGEQIDPTFIGDAYLLPTNYWAGSVSGKSTMVIATALKENPLQGVVIVMEDGHPANARAYTTPNASGPVRIVTEKMACLPFNQ